MLLCVQLLQLRLVRRLQLLLLVGGVVPLHLLRLQLLLLLLRGLLLARVGGRQVGLVLWRGCSVAGGSHGDRLGSGGRSVSLGRRSGLCISRLRLWRRCPLRSSAHSSVRSVWRGLVRRCLRRRRSISGGVRRRLLLLLQRQLLLRRRWREFRRQLRRRRGAFLRLGWLLGFGLDFRRLLCSSGVLCRNLLQRLLCRGGCGAPDDN